MAADTGKKQIPFPNNISIEQLLLVCMKALMWWRLRRLLGMMMRMRMRMVVVVAAVHQKMSNGALWLVRGSAGWAHWLWVRKGKGRGSLWERSSASSHDVCTKVAHFNYFHATSRHYTHAKCTNGTGGPAFAKLLIAFLIHDHYFVKTIAFSFELLPPPPPSLSSYVNLVWTPPGIGISLHSFIFWIFF